MVYVPFVGSPSWEPTSFSHDPLPIFFGTVSMRLKALSRSPRSWRVLANSGKSYWGRRCLLWVVFFAMTRNFQLSKIRWLSSGFYFGEILTLYLNFWHFCSSGTLYAQRKNPKHQIIFPRRHPRLPQSPTLVREGSVALPDTLPERGIDTGGIYTTMPASEMMRE